MLQNVNPLPADMPNAGDLSPVKRALIEIRHLREELEKSKRGMHEPVAIVGMAMRFPGGVTTPERFWEALAEGEDLIGAVPAERWDAREYLNTDPDHAGTMYDGHGGFLADIDAFDAEFFGINPREAASMDPQQRMLLELTWEALERAAIDPKALFNSSAGVFLGLSNCDYARYTMRDPREIDAYASVGCTLSIAAGRISYFLGTHGPALVVDTACSSSLVALDLAMQSLRRDEIDLAIVGAANLILTPEYSVSFSRTRMLSPHGRSKTFDASADGYVRSEGCGVVILRRLADAKRDGDPVLAKIVGMAVNQDGRSAGITAPNGPAQEAAIRAALDDAQVAPTAVTFVETHGTGTPLGDPMEVQALSAVYGTGRDGRTPLHIGSVKTNLGHAEAAAGMAGLMKVVLTMQPGHGIAPHLHFNEPNQKIDWKSLPIKVPTALTPWPQTDSGTRYAGLSSFGFSGTNAHMIIASADDDAPAADVKADGGDVESVLVISASHPESLRKQAESYAAFLQQTSERFSDICFTALTGRASLEHRLALRARDPRSAASMLEQWLAGKTVAGLVSKDSAPEVTKDKIMQLLVRYIQGESLSWEDLHAAGEQRRVALPVYPFRKTRYWFGPDPQKKRQMERERVWQSAVAAAEVQSRQGPLGWDPGSYAERWSTLHRLTLAHAQKVLAEAGAFRKEQVVSADDVLARCGFQPLYRRLVQHWLEGLAASGLLAAEGDRFRASAGFGAASLETHWRETEQQLWDNPGMMAYLRQCSAVLGDVLTGRKSSLETLFPQGSFSIAEGLYETGPEARFLNPIAAAAVNQVARGLGQRRNARVLEIGGGTGGTTSAILPTLPAGQAEYWFTDVSELFLNRAQRRFGAYPFVHYALFDLDRPLEEQGIAAGQFDVIVAANVVHASRNLKTALERVRRLLAPGGMLVLMEWTTHHSCFDMTIGLIEGWQHFEDDIRQEHPLLRTEQWKSVLEASGFSSMVALPEADSPASAIGEHVLIARSPEVDQIESYVIPQNVVAGEWRQYESTQAESIGDHDAIGSLRALSPDDREQAVLDLVRITIQRVFNLSQRAEELTARERLSDLGMDSLIALELRAELAKVFGLEAQISSTIAFDTGTVGELAKALLRAVDISGQEEIQSGELEVRSEDLPSVAQVTLDELNEMTDEDVERLLSERLSRR
jgi:3-oxoacyl-(acyl-carrier-protein) synthase/SAM-dependent methyltransferase